MLTIDSELLTQFPISSDVYYVTPVSNPPFPYGVSKGTVSQVGFKFIENDENKFIPYLMVREERNPQSVIEITNFTLVSLNQKEVVKLITDYKREWESSSEKLQQIKKDLSWGFYAK